MIREPITPTQREIQAWRLMAETYRNFGGVRLGDFDWPWVVLSLIAELEKLRPQPAGDTKP